MSHLRYFVLIAHRVRLALFDLLLQQRRYSCYILALFISGGAIVSHCSCSEETGISKKHRLFPRRRSQCGPAEPDLLPGHPQRML